MKGARGSLAGALSLYFAGSLFYFAGGLGLAACEPKPASSPDSLMYSADARAAYLAAMDAFDSQNWEEARQRLLETKRAYAQSPVARLAELRLADLEFEQGKYSEATAAYRTFGRAHRTDENVEYARYRIAKGAYLDIGDTFLLPPAEERDQGNAEEAYRELAGFNEQYAGGRYRQDARYMLEVVTQRLVRHELFVARHYLNDDRFEAAIARIEYAIARYPGSGLDAEALVLKGETLLKLHKTDAARAAFARVVAEFGGPFATVAQRFLAQMDEAAALTISPAAAVTNSRVAGANSPAAAVTISPAAGTNSPVAASN